MFRCMNFVINFSLCSVVVEALKVDSLQRLCSSLEPILRRVVSISDSAVFIVVDNVNKSVTFFYTTTTTKFYPIR